MAVITKEFIRIADDFSDMPYGRDELDGPFNGKVFREKILTPSLKAYPIVHIDMNGTMGYGSSFLDEAFGGLVRDDGFSADELKSRLKLEHSRATVLNRAWNYIEEASN
ncbi:MULTISPECIES: STAS-like domain-containing protein [Aeromonas]|jgi:hypothetical protein|uniref:STAS-like domain-containing protein n=1 Tax=Aeromonas TaxID=642 RepID=UPI001C56ED48|nr:STAS-like domain-containing protein [Aeromonas veronii]